MNTISLHATVIVLLVLALTSPVFSGQAAHPEYAVVKQTVEDSIGWAIEKDFDRLFSIIVPDEHYFSLWLFGQGKKIGYEAFKKGADVWRTPEFKATHFEFKNLRIVFSKSGTVAWYSADLDDCYELGGKPDCLRDVKQTGVLEKRDGRWYHVQMHGSYPVDKVPEKYIQRFYKEFLETGKHPVHEYGYGKDETDPPGGEHTAVRAAIETMIGWAIEKDFDAMFNVTAHDDDYYHFWLFSGSEVVGYDNWVKYAEQWKTPSFRGTGFKFKDLRIRFSESGDVAWYSTWLDDCGEVNGRETCLNDLFQTGVLEKRKGRWVHTQIHGSYPIDQIPGRMLETFYGKK